MVVKLYISGISGNKEVKKRQQRVLLILESKNIKYELFDIAEPNMEEAKEYMQNNSKMNGGTISDPNPRHPLPPQIFNDDEYCGDYDAFDLANENDEMEKFLKLPFDETTTFNAEIKLGNGEIPSGEKSKEGSPEKSSETQEIEEKPESNEANEEIGKENPKEKSPSPEKEKSPPIKEKSPSPQKEKSPSPTKEDVGDNETDDQKAENAESGGKEEDEETAKDVEDTEETEKSEEA